MGFNVNGIDRQLSKLEKFIGNKYDESRNNEALQIIYGRLVTMANRMIDADSLDDADQERMSPMEIVALSMAKVWVETRDETEVIKAFDEGLEPLAEQRGNL